VPDVQHWKCAACATTGESPSAAAPPLGWYSYTKAGEVLEAACSDACMGKRRWADVDDYRTARVVDVPPDAAPVKRVVPLTCHGCGKAAWVAQHSMSRNRSGLALSCGCGAVVIVNLAE
jgi:hypothetical protein